MTLKKITDDAGLIASSLIVNDDFDPSGHHPAPFVHTPVCRRFTTAPGPLSPLSPLSPLFPLSPFSPSLPWQLTAGLSSLSGSSTHAFAVSSKCWLWTITAAPCRHSLGYRACPGGRTSFLTPFPCWPLSPLSPLP